MTREAFGWYLTFVAGLAVGYVLARAVDALRTFSLVDWPLEDNE